MSRCITTVTKVSSAWLRVKSLRNSWRRRRHTLGLSGLKTLRCLEFCTHIHLYFKIDTCPCARLALPSMQRRRYASCRHGGDNMSQKIKSNVARFVRNLAVGLGVSAVAMSAAVPVVSQDRVQIEWWYANSGRLEEDRKSTRLNSSHVKISYAVF